MNEPCDTRAHGGHGRHPGNTPIREITEPVAPDDDIYERLGARRPSADELAQVVADDREPA